MVLTINFGIMEESWSPLADNHPDPSVFQEACASQGSQQSFSNLSPRRRRQFRQRCPQEAVGSHQCRACNRRQGALKCVSSEKFAPEVNETPHLPSTLSSELAELSPVVKLIQLPSRLRGSHFRQHVIQSRDHHNGYLGWHSESSADLFQPNPHLNLHSPASLGYPQDCPSFSPFREADERHGGSCFQLPNHHRHCSSHANCIDQSDMKQVQNKRGSDMLPQASKSCDNMRQSSAVSPQSPHSPGRNFCRWSPSCVDHRPSITDTNRAFESESTCRVKTGRSLDHCWTGLPDMENTECQVPKSYTMQRSTSYDLAFKPSSQPFSDISRTDTSQTSPFMRSSSSDCTRDLRKAFADDNDYLAVYGIHSRCRSSEMCLRRTVSYEPQSHDARPTIVKTQSQGEIDSDYVYLDNRYTLDKYTNLRHLNESAAHLPFVASNTQQPLRANNSIKHIQHNNNFMSEDDDDDDDYDTNTVHVVGSSNLARSSRSMLKTNHVSDSRSPKSNKKSTAGALRIMAETFGSLFSPKASDNFRSSSSPRRVDISRGSLSSVQKTTNRSLRRSRSGQPYEEEEEARTLSRSKSLSDLPTGDHGAGSVSRNYSDDEDGDDFGFLSYPVSFKPSSTSTAMSKAKSPSPGKRIIPKRWRSKTNALPIASTSVAMWTPGPLGTCSWSSVSGRKVQLRAVSILCLTEAERVTLQKVALSRLQTMDLGCAVSIPKDIAEQPRAKKSPMSMKRRSKSVSASALDTMAKDGTGLGLVFGIPLLKCILNDRELEKRRRRMEAAVPAELPSSVTPRTDSSDNLLVMRSARKSSNSSQGSVENSNGVISQNLDSLTVPSYKRAASSDSLSESESSRNTSSSLIDALSLSTSNPASRPSSLAIEGSQLANQGEAQVPYIVKACFRHIEMYGLKTLGIFRVGCSKKRVKQLREEFDSGKEVRLTEEHNPHDVGALLKEYFRDLPEPLLTRELYLPFLYAERMKDEHSRHAAVRLLISMLPVANRDTLWALLRFLAVVSQNASDVSDDLGGTVSGNKMDTHNLATLFGPNILHSTKTSSDKELMSESTERVEQSKEVIGVVKDMIDNHHELFEISGTLRDEVLRLLIESNQETADKILRHLANQNQIEADPESTSSVFEDSASYPTQYHTVNSDADLLAFARRQTSASHRPLRITKSADDSLESPTSRSPALPSRNSLLTSRDNQKPSSSNPVPPVQLQYESGHGYPSPVPNRIPELKKPHDSATQEEVVHRGRLELGKLDRPYSEGFNQSLNIPRPLYVREKSYSSASSGHSSALNNHSGSDSGSSGHWIISTPPVPQTPSPKQFFQSPSSPSSTLIPSLTSSQLNHALAQGDSYTRNTSSGSHEWEKERWKYWEKLAAQKQTPDTEQETLV